jgi:NitT/TauT family transport system permease protein
MPGQALEIPLSEQAAVEAARETATVDAVAEAAAPAPTPARRSWRLLLPFLTSIAGAIALAIHTWVPSQQSKEPTSIYPRLLWIAIVFGVVLGLTQRLWRSRKLSLRRAPLVFVPHAISNVLHWCVVNGPILAASILLLCAWDMITLKFALMPLPYFPGPDAVIQSLVDNWQSPGRGQPGLADCMWHSLALLSTGYTVGCLVGITWGVLIGWFPHARYWGMPVMKILGPIPATAFIPLSIMVFPDPLMSAVSLIALAVWFPVTMLTFSGISNVRASYLDVARTLGAGRFYLIFRVAIPAAMPSIFVGLFMGLGASFLTLIVAEAVGVQAGLGWYMDWARAYSDYTKVYAALVIMAAYFSTIMTMLFKVRDIVLVWQKGVIKW